MNCKNCGHFVEGNYCSNCGQSANVGRFNLSDFLNDFSESIFQINRGLLFTVKELFVRPGLSIREFLDGKRQSHFKPMGYVLTFSALYFLISRIVGGNTWANDLLFGFANAASDSEGDMKMVSLLTFLADNFSYATLLALPIFSLASYISFRKFDTNYLEHVILNSYIAGQQAILYSVFLLLTGYANSDFLESISVLTSVLYTFWVFWQFFSTGNRIVNILRSALTYALYLAFGVLFLTVVFVIHILTS